MNINFKKYLMTGLFLFAVSSILCASNLYAAEVFQSLTETGWEIFGGMRRIIWGAAGFGIIAVCIGGFFGALNWKWLTAIIVGLVVIGLTVGIVQYLGAGTGGSVSVGSISDTLK
jgi:hypothetical protein